VPLATPHQYSAMLDAAADGRYAYAAINVTSSETLNAALRGFKRANADGIVHISVGGAEYMSGAAVKDALLGARAFARYAHVVAEASPVLVGLHTDHCPPAHVDDWLHPLLAESQRRVELGATPLFHSHMFDGSTLPLDENLRIASALLAKCSALDVILEVESGVVGGEEDGIVGPANGRDELYTTPSDLLRVADALGIGERGRYVLAAVSATCTEPTPPAAWACGPRSCRQASRRSQLRIATPASSMCSMAAADPPSVSSRTRSRSES
jgi:fructose-bisphosphate aldolase class II